MKHIRKLYQIHKVVLYRIKHLLYILDMFEKAIALLRVQNSRKYSEGRPTLIECLPNKYFIDHGTKMNNLMRHVTMNLNAIKILHKLRTYKSIRAHISSGST